MANRAPFVCDNCARGCRRRYECPCGLTDCRHSLGVCGRCWRIIETKAIRRRDRTVPAWLDIDRLADIDVDDLTWKDRIACGFEPLDTFFPPLVSNRFDYTEAAKVCDRCPVRHECLAAHLPSIPRENDRQSGCYVGGTTPAQRTLIRDALKARAHRGAA